MDICTLHSHAHPTVLIVEGVYWESLSLSVISANRELTAS